MDPSGAVVQVNSGFVPLRAKPTILNVHATFGKVGEQANLPGFRIRSLYVGGGDYLVVAGSTSAISAQGRRLALDVALIGFLVAIVDVGVGAHDYAQGPSHHGAPHRLRQ